MSATILAFPSRITAPSRDALRCTGSISAIELARKFTDHFLPIVQASVDLLEADERDFEGRCRRMLDTDGTAMIDELCAEMDIVGRQMKLLVDGLDLTQVRLRTAMTRLAASTKTTRGNG